MDNLNWTRKIALADLKTNQLRSIMTIVAVIIIATLSSICFIMYLSLLYSSDKMIQNDVNFSVSFYIFMIIPVIFCGFLLIIDCFHLNKQNSVRQNGLLSSIGLTKKQNRSLIRWQTIYLTVIGFVISFALTIIIIYVILPLFINDIYSDFNVLSFKGIVLVLGCAGMLSMALVNSGLYISYYESEQMSISERINYSGKLSYIRTTEQSISALDINSKYPKHWLNGNVIAFKNYIRNIKNNSHVLVSLVFSLSTLMIVSIVISGINPSSFASSYVGNNDFKLFNRTFAYNYTKDNTIDELLSKGGGVSKSPSEEVFSQDFITEVRNNDMINSIKIIKCLNISYDYSEDPDGYYFGDFLLVVDTDYIMSRYSSESEPSEEVIRKFEKGQLAFLPSNSSSAENLSIQIKGNVVREGTPMSSYDPNAEKNKFSLPLYAIPNLPSEGNPEVEGGLFVHENFLNTIDISPIISSVEFSADKEDRVTVQKWVDAKVANNDLIVSESRDRFAALAQAQKDATYLVGYLLSFSLLVISLIGFLIVNIVSIETRRKEFFLLKCVGMRQYDIRAMLFKEGLIYGLVILLIMLLVSNPVIYFIYNTFKMYYNAYHFPLILFITVILFIIATVTTIPIYVYNKTQKR